jgi:hypothetical protein
VTEITERCTKVRQKRNKFPVNLNLIYSFAFLPSFFLKMVPTKQHRDVTIEDETIPVNLLCSSKVTYLTDHSYA